MWWSMYKSMSFFLKAPIQSLSERSQALLFFLCTEPERQEQWHEWAGKMESNTWEKSSMTATQKCHCQLTYAIFCHSHNQINTLQSFIKMELVFNESFFMKCCYISCPQKLFPHNNSHCNLHNGVKMLCILTSFESIFMWTWNKHTNWYFHHQNHPCGKNSLWVAMAPRHFQSFQTLFCSAYNTVSILYLKMQSHSK